MRSEFSKKFVTPQEAVKAVRPGDWVDYGFGAGFPELLDRALAARKEELKDVKIRGGLVIRPKIEVVEADPQQEAFTYYSWHIGDYERKLQSRGLCHFVPMILRFLPELYRSHIRVDVAFVPVSVPDEDGYCGLGISNYAWKTIMSRARTVVFEINEHLPRLKGVDGSHRVSLSDADYVVEGEHEPLPVRSYREPSETEQKIARLVVDEIPDGAVLSLGVGGVPYTVARMLAQSDVKDLGCHTGTISDAFMELYRAGKLTNGKKEIDRGLSTWNLAMGSEEFYRWLDEEPAAQTAPESTAQAPAQEETAAPAESVPAVGTVLLSANYTGTPLPDNYTMDKLSLGALETVNPILGHLRSTYGYRDHPVDGEYKFHNGVDIGGQMGEPIGAFAAGTVEYIGENDDHGLYLQIDHGNGVKSFYAHCSKLLVSQGQQVAMGETVALVGSTGVSTGPHLHFEIKCAGVHVDPAYYLTFLTD